jgi:hypothetical protein
MNLQPVSANHPHIHHDKDVREFLKSSAAQMPGKKLVATEVRHGRWVHDFILDDNGDYYHRINEGHVAVKTLDELNWVELGYLLKAAADHNLHY